MRYIIAMMLIATSLIADAQKKFDSAAYVDFYANRWDKVDFNARMADVPVPELTAEEKIAGLSKSWAEAKYNFANFDLVPTLNWDSLYLSFIPKVTATKTTVEYYKALQEFYRYLIDGHTAIFFPFAIMKQRNGLIDIDIRWIENKALVTANRSGQKLIQPGMELVEWNGKALQEYIQSEISPYLHYSTPQDSTERIYRYELLRGVAGQKVLLGFKAMNGNVVQQEFAFTPVENIWNRGPLLEFKILKGNVGYLKLNSFADEKIVKMFDSVFQEMEKTNALIIDIRGNGGGNGGNGFEILGYLTDKPFMTGKTVIRQYRPVGRSWGGPERNHIEGDDWKPYKNKLYNKQVVVLTSGATYSAAEDFTSVFKGINRAKVIGAPTGGSTGQPVFFTLPGGGLGAVCSKRDFIADGTEFVGVGIQPDIVVKPTQKGVAEGRDEVLEAALRVIGG